MTAAVDLTIVCLLFLYLGSLAMAHSLQQQTGLWPISCVAFKIRICLKNIYIEVIVYYPLLRRRKWRTSAKMTRLPKMSPAMIAQGTIKSKYFSS